MRQLSVGGHAVLVDDADYDLVVGHRWHIRAGGKNLYACASVNGTSVSMHRLVLGAAAGTVVDHIDGNGLNNRKANLRLCTRKQNFQNGRWRETRGRTSRFKGVWWIKRRCRRCWRAAITADMIRRNIGSFHTELEAAEAYDEAARRLHGEFARLNFPDAGRRAA